jgi:hypothetical protein
MTSQEIVSEAEPHSEDRTTSPNLDYPLEESHWSQNHGPTLIAIAAFTLIVGYGVIFFNSTAVEVNNKPLVPNNFVPDEEGAEGSELQEAASNPSNKETGDKETGEDQIERADETTPTSGAKKSATEDKVKPR